MALATREQMLQAFDFQTETIDVPQWGEVRIRDLSAKERIDLAEKHGDKVTGRQALNMLCDLIAIAVIDEDGKPVFSPDDAAVLAEKNWSHIQKVSNRIMVLSGMKDDEVSGVVAEAEKNFETSPSDCSPSASA